MQEITDLLSSYSFSLNNEKLCQLEIEEILKLNNINFKREYDLRPSGGKGIVDFMINDSIAIEVKLKGQRKSIYRQCRDYCCSTEVNSLILLSNVAMQLPGEIYNKRCQVISLGNSHL